MFSPVSETVSPAVIAASLASLIRSLPFGSTHESSTPYIGRPVALVVELAPVSLLLVVFAICASDGDVG